VLGGQWGEMSVTMAYLFQAWNRRGPAKYKDTLLDIGTEEIGHVEMLATLKELEADGLDRTPAPAAATDRGRPGGSSVGRPRAPGRSPRPLSRSPA